MQSVAHSKAYGCNQRPWLFCFPIKLHQIDSIISSIQVIELLINSIKLWLYFAGLLIVMCSNLCLIFTVRGPDFYKTRVPSGGTATVYVVSGQCVIRYACSWIQTLVKVLVKQCVISLWSAWLNTNENCKMKKQWRFIPWLVTMSIPYGY